MSMEYKNNFETVGRWWNDESTELVKISGVVYGLYGWNGEQYTESWKCSGEFNNIASKEIYSIRPLFEEVGEGEFEVIGYDITETKP